MRIAGALAMTAALALVGCGQDYVTDSQASVLLVVDHIEEGAPVLSDIISEGAIVNCDVTVGVSVVLKNPNAGPSDRDDVRLTSYEVKYSRSDGRNVQGVDVPYDISGPLRANVLANTALDVAVTVVRHQAKIEPPLKNITGLDIVTMGAEVTIYGQTLNGDGVSGQGSVQITFADYADGTSTCESN